MQGVARDIVAQGDFVAGFDGALFAEQPCKQQVAVHRANMFVAFECREQQPYVRRALFDAPPRFAATCVAEATAFALYVTGADFFVEGGISARIFFA